MRRNVSQLWVGGHHSTNVVAHIAASYSREIQVSVSRYESFFALLDFLSESVEEPDVVDVLGVFVIVETVDDGLAEALGDYVRTLAFLEAVQDDLAQVHYVAVDGAEVVRRFAIVGARVFALRLTDD